MNLNKNQGGIARNIIPSEFKATFDVRITPKLSIKEFEEKFCSWIAEAEGDDSDSGRITYECKEWTDTSDFALTSTDENKNLWWKKFLETCAEL